jgi:hypothetical protein
MKNEGRRYEAIARMCGARIGEDLNAFPGWYGTHRFVTYGPMAS